MRYHYNEIKQIEDYYTTKLIFFIDEKQKKIVGEVAFLIYLST